jgi:hypothetical protein
VRYRVDPNIWDLPQFASMPYDQLMSDYLAWLSARTERGGPASADTIRSARDTLGSFGKALVAEGEPLVASSISARNSDAWVKHLLAGDLPYAQIRLKSVRLIDHPRASRRQPMSAAKIAQHTGARRTITKLALRGGEDPIRVQLMMGWASPALVLGHSDEVALETASAKLVEYAPI